MTLIQHAHAERKGGKKDTFPFWSGIFSRHSSIIFLLVFALEVAVGAWVIHDVRTANVVVEKMYEGSVLGLRGIGELQYEAQETRRSTLYALTTNDGNLQVEYADQSREADRRVTKGIDRYATQAQSPGAAELGKHLSQDWLAYLRVRDDVLGLILEGDTQKAVEVDLRQGVGAFERVRQDLESIKRLYDDQASQQLIYVQQSSNRSVIKLIIVLCFVLFFGSASVWVIERSRVMATLQLAELQMDFVASVSHELRTPITAILSAGENIRDGLVTTIPDLQEQGTIITNQACGLMELVDQVLLFAATTKSKSYHVIEPLQISEIVDCALVNTTSQLQEAGFTVDKQIPAGLPRVDGDLSALAQCLQNLIVNAIKYSNRRRTITISASPEIDSHREGVAIRVQDHGMGISESELAKIFEPFYRSPRVIAEQIHGTGLGLSIAKRTVEAFGGKLSVVSEVGVGSIFTLHLPSASGAPKAVGVTARHQMGIQE